MKKNNYITLLSIVVFLVLFGYYYIAKYDSKNFESKSVENKVIVLNTSKPLWPGQFLIPLAYELGYMREEGIILSFTEYDSDLEIQKSLKNNTIDFACGLASDYFSHFQNEGCDNSKIVLAVDYSNGGDAIVARENAPPLDSNKIKVFSGAVDYKFFVPYALSQLGAKKNTIEYKEYPTSEEMVVAFKNKEIDYMATFGPYIKEAEDMGGSVIYSSKDSSGLLLDVLVFRDEVIKKNQCVLDKFLNAYYKAYSYWKNNRRDAYRKVAHYYDLTPEEFEREMDGFILLDLDDNIGAMITEVGLKSIYGHLKLVQQYDESLKDRNDVNISNFVYFDAVSNVKKQKRCEIDNKKRY